VPGSVRGAAERRRTRRVGELDGDGFQQRSAGIGRHDSVELLDSAFRLVSTVKPHESDTLRQTYNTSQSIDLLSTYQMRFGLLYCTFAMINLFTKTEFYTTFCS